MTTNITPFAFGDNMVRVHMDENGEPWFVAKDVARALGYSENSINQLANLFRHVPEEWAALNPRPVPYSNAAACRSPTGWRISGGSRGE